MQNHNAFRFLIVSRISIVIMLIGFMGSTDGTSAYGKNSLTVTDLKCDYATNPLGIDSKTPQLSWRIDSNARGAAQSAYHILVADSTETLNQDVGNVWDSGICQSSQSSGVTCEANELLSRKIYYWKAKAWDSHNSESDWSDTATFEMGLTREDDWKGAWVGVLTGWSGKPLCFKRTFHISKPVKQARLYISGIGYYKVEINGSKVGDQVLDPAISEYSKRVYYATHDIAKYFTRDNVMVVTVGQGWYGTPKLRLQMETVYDDGTSETITSTDVRSVTTGPIRKSAILDGETYDARHENPELATTSPIYGQNRVWAFAHIADPPGGKMAAQTMEPIKVVETLAPQKISEPAPGVYVIDAGQNLAGWAALKVTGTSGTVITLKFAEMLYDNGLVNQENLRSAEATDTYILKGGGAEETWEPSFTYHGFRYIQVEGFPFTPGPDNIRIQRVRSAVNQVGKFSCSNDLLNRIHKMVAATEASNLHSVPTDCPQRDERMGWLNDMTVRIEQALYNFDLSRFYTKFIADVSDTQSPDGAITCTAPFRFGNRPADPVSASYLLLALKSYHYYGNTGIIRDHYDNMKAWVDYLNSRTDDGIVNYSYYGDWSPPIAFGRKDALPVSRDTPGEFMSTGYLYYCSRMLSQMAAILGKAEDVAAYDRLAVKTAAAMNRKWWDEKTGGYAANNQASNSFALFLGIVPDDKVSSVVKNLVKNVQDQNYHLSTGNLCTKYVMEMLTEHGHADVAFRIAAQETYPSWGYMLANGATTLWERWELGTGSDMNSHNHPMMGSVDSWFYKYVLGILPDSAGPGFEKFTIHPRVINELEYASGEINTVKGLVKCDWKKEDGHFLMSVTVPGNSTARVFIPTKQRASITEGNKPVDQSQEIEFIRDEGNYAVYQVGSGKYRFKSTW